MTRIASPVAPAVEITEDERRRRPVWKPLAAAGIGGAVLLAAGYGVFASLQATATSSAQEVSSGTIALTLADAGAGFTQKIDKIAPNDVVNRFVTLTNSGSLAAKDLGLKVAAVGSDALITGGTTAAGTAILPLQVTIDSCSVAWANNACSAGATSLFTKANLSTLTGATPVALQAAERAAGAVNHLRVSVSLPEQTETTVNGVVPTANTIQGQTAALTWTFSETQRNGVTTTS